MSQCVCGATVLADLPPIEVLPPTAARQVVEPLTGSAAAHVDGCPSCVVNVEAPYGGFTTPSGDLVCMYLCTDCGHRWHTSWKEADGGEDPRLQA